MSKRAQLLLCIFWLVMVPVASAVSAQDGRPKRFPDFMEGYRAYENDNWQRAADFMWKACIIWDEDGRNVIVYADQPEPYLPRYYLGVALFNLGCYREALHHFEKSLLNQQTIRGTEKQADNLRSLKQKCKEFLEYEEENAEVNCSKWLIDTEEEPAVITEGPREPDQSPDDTH